MIQSYRGGFLCLALKPANSCVWGRRFGMTCFVYARRFFDAKTYFLKNRYAYRSVYAYADNSGLQKLTKYKSFSYVQNVNFHASSGGGEIHVEVPSMGDSITEGTLSEWKVAVGSYVNEGELLAAIDTDKVSVDINAVASGKLVKIEAGEGEIVEVGKPLYVLDTAAVPSNTEAFINQDKVEAGDRDVAAAADLAAAAGVVPAATAAPTSPAAAALPAAPFAAPPVAPFAAPPAAAFGAGPVSVIHTGPCTSELGSVRTERRVPMSRMRMRIAERLKTAQKTTAMLTTFNEVDMGNLMAMRSEMNKDFQEVHGVKMGFVSAFMMASALSLKKFPDVNAYLEDNQIIYKDYVDISVAVATPSGLVVPVVRDCEKKSWAQLEYELAGLATKARKGQIALEDMIGGTFTISNGGVYGSMLGTPIINSPQSSILGMHAVAKRAVVRDDQIVIRPIMYLALTYDHRLIDGREAVTFLCSIRDYIQDPRKILLGL